MNVQKYWSRWPNRRAMSSLLYTQIAYCEAVQKHDNLYTVTKSKNITLHFAAQRVHAHSKARLLRSFPGKPCFLTNRVRRTICRQSTGHISQN